jgi:hypothetical protein
LCAGVEISCPNARMNLHHYDIDELVLNPIDIKTQKGIIRSLVNTNSNQRIKMKSTKLFAFALSLASLMYLTACDDNNDDHHNNNNNGTIAPAGLGARTVSVAVNDGSAPFSNTGAYTLTTQGSANDTTGSYTITGDGTAIGDSSGTFTYNRTGTNTATLVLEDSSLGTVNSELTFDAANSGSLTSSDSSGGFQTGTFNIQ